MTTATTKPFKFETWQDAEDVYYSFPFHVRTCVDDPDVEQDKIMRWMDDHNFYVNE